jgi:hypothetical protein
MRAALIFAASLSLIVLPGCKSQDEIVPPVTTVTPRLTSLKEPESKKKEPGAVTPSPGQTLGPIVVADGGVPGEAAGKVADDGHGHDGEVHGVDRYGSLEKAMEAEAACMGLSGALERVECLDGLADWWFHFGGDHISGNPHAQMVRVMQIQSALDPADLGRMATIA